LITLDRFDRPLGGELTGISAKEDDPGLAQWAVSDLSRSLGALGLSRIPPEMFQGIKLPVIPPELLRSLLNLPVPKSQPPADIQPSKRDSAESGSSDDDQSDEDTGNSEDSDDESGSGI